MYVIKKGKKISNLKKDYNMYYHKEIKLWGIGEPNQNTEYCITISGGFIDFINYKKHKEFIDNFVKDLKQRDWLEVK